MDNSRRLLRGSWASRTPSRRQASWAHRGSTDFTPLWSSQAAALAREMPAKMLIDIPVREATAHPGVPLWSQWLMRSNHGTPIMGP